MMRTLRIIYICNILFYIFNILSICILVTIISTTSSLSSQQLTWTKAVFLGAVEQFGIPFMLPLLIGIPFNHDRFSVIKQDFLRYSCKELKCILWLYVRWAMENINYPLMDYVPLLVPF